MEEDMTQMQKFSAFGLIAIAAVLNVALIAQSADPVSAIQDKMGNKFKLTTTTADRTDIVKSGDIVELRKSGLVMCSVASPSPGLNSYRNGSISQGLLGGKGGALFHGVLHGQSSDDAMASCATRKFVAGEKFWITGVTAKQDGLVVQVYSDPYSDVRYYGELKFPYDKKNVPQVAIVEKSVDDALNISPADDKGGDSQAKNDKPAPAPAPAPAPPPAPMQDIAPPPPPADTPPPTIAVGQTKDQVVAGFGQPTRISKPSATREIYVYKDMKVTFTNGKVSNIEEK
jgi:hypothetical protein